MELESPEKKAMVVARVSGGLRDPLTIGNSSAYRWERNGSISGGRRCGVALVKVAECQAPLLYQYGYAELCLPSLGPSLAAVV